VRSSRGSLLLRCGAQRGEKRRPDRRLQGGRRPVQLDHDIFSAAGALGTLSANAFFAGAAAHDADDRIIYDSATGNLYYDADGNGAAAQVLFADLGTGLALTNADFSIVG
jgi:hypothetical protein